MSILLRTALASLFLWGCVAKPSGLTEKEANLVRKETITMLNAYNNAIRSKGLLAEFEYLDSSKQFSWFPPGFSTWISYDSVASVLRANSPKLKSVNNSWDTLRIEPIARDLAAYTGVLLSETEDTSGKITRVRLKETGVLIRRNDKWKLLTGQTAVLESNP
jgi:hypothetical protein